MTTPANSRAVAAALVFLAGTALPALAQDSVSSTPGLSDAMSPYSLQRVRYVVDLVPLTSSWNNNFAIAPVMKAGADPDPMFPTLILGASSLSADQLLNPAFASVNFSLWTAPGEGVNPEFNSPAGSSVPATTFSRQFGLVFNDLSDRVTDVVGATIGQNSAEPMRLFVTRVQAVNSRVDPTLLDTATLSLGSIDASGNAKLRADPFNAADPETIQGENIVRVALGTRNQNIINYLRKPLSTNIAGDNAATVYSINNGSVTTNPPTSLPASLAGLPFSLVLDFSNKYRANGALGVSTHLAANITSHRGNPSFSSITSLGGVGTVGSLARSTTGAGKVDSINLFGVSAAGAPLAPARATLPVPITAGSFSANASGNAQFLQYLSQVGYRGPSGQVGLGFDPALNAPVAAAVATDPSAGEFVAVARFTPGTPTWTAAGWVGKPVRSGPSGSIVGTIIAGAPNVFSYPAADLQGNVYFVARYQPSAGAPTTALIKAVNTSGSEPYPLELILAAGQSFTGANSNTLYTIQSLTLSDSDSVASGAFGSAGVLQGLLPGATPAGAADPFSFGGAVVNAQISYTNAGIPENYQAVLFISPRAASTPACPGDVNGDGMVGLADIAGITTCWNQPAACNPGADQSGDGTIGLADIAVVTSNWATTCP